MGLLIFNLLLRLKTNVWAFGIQYNFSSFFKVLSNNLGTALLLCIIWHIDQIITEIEWTAQSFY